MRPVPSLATAALAAVFAVAHAAAHAVSAQADVRRGAPFGNNKYRTEISTGAAADVDDYVSGLVAGEVLSVSVTADRGSALEPALTLLDPDGVDRTPALRESKGGAALSFRKFAVDATGRWTVRIAGARNTTGAYTAKFAVKPTAAVKLPRNGIGGDAPIERTHEISGVDGAVLVAQIKARTATVPAVTAAVGPSGLPVVVSGGELRGRKRTYDGVALDEGDGGYSVTVAIEEGEAEYDLTLALEHPGRPKGTIELAAAEPRVLPVLVPFTGHSKAVFRIDGGNFSRDPRPRVFFGDVEATVLGVGPNGEYVNVGPPDGLPGTRVCVAVQNTDGQAAVAADYFEYVAPEQADLLSITPNSVSVYAGSAVTFAVTLDRPAPAEGVTVTLASGPLGNVPAQLGIPAFATSGQFQFAANGNPGSGQITASLRDVTLTADVTVVALPGGGGGGEPPPPLPDEIDIGGWVIRQANSSRDFTFPAGTKLKAGEYAVVARTPYQANFESYWSVTLGTNVKFFTDPKSFDANSSDDWPSVNGDETYQLGIYTTPGSAASFVAFGAATIPMVSGGGSAYSRSTLDGSPGDTSVWTTNPAGPGNGSTPGGGHAVGGTKHGVLITEFADASGSGNYVYEYVELFFDGLKP